MERITSSAIVISTGDYLLSIPKSSIRRVAVSRERFNTAGRDILIGAAARALIFSLPALVAKPDPYSWLDSRKEQFLIISASEAVPGADRMNFRIHGYKGPVGRDPLNLSINMSPTLPELRAFRPFGALRFLLN